MFVEVFFFDSFKNSANMARLSNNLLLQYIVRLILGINSYVISLKFGNVGFSPQQALNTKNIHT